MVYRKGFISAEQVEKLAHAQPNSYGQYLLEMLEPDRPDGGPAQTNC